MTPTESPDFPHQPRPILCALFVGARLWLHLCYGAILAVFYPLWSRQQQRATLQKWCGQLLAILHITRHGSPPDDLSTQGLLVVANHVSWLDIFVLNSVLPLRFIAKNEVRDWFLIGWLCRRTDTLFIKRATRQHLIEMNQTVADALENQDRIGLFPEGTTTEGCQVGEFYPALFQGAVDAAAPILPVCVYYHDPQGKHSQLAAYAGETSLLSSIWQILRCHDLHVTLTFFPVLSTVDSNRRTLAHATHHTISQHLTTATHQAQAQDSTALPYVLLPNCSAYALLLDPIINQILR